MRPEGWTKGGNPKIDGVQYYNYNEESYEAGADAMLEALKKSGKYFSRGSVVNQDAYPDKKWVNVAGYLVFIEE